MSAHLRRNGRDDVQHDVSAFLAWFGPRRVDRQHSLHRQVLNRCVAQVLQRFPVCLRSALVSEQALSVPESRNLPDNNRHRLACTGPSSDLRTQFLTLTAGQPVADDAPAPGMKTATAMVPVSASPRKSARSPCLSCRRASRLVAPSLPQSKSPCSPAWSSTLCPTGLALSARTASTSTTVDGGDYGQEEEF